MKAAAPPTETRRWPVIAALGIQQIIAWGATYYILAVLGPSIAADTGWPQQWVIGALSIALVVGGLGAPLTGRTIARFGGRLVLVSGTLIVSSSLLLMAAAPSLAVYLVAWLVMGVGMATSLYDAAFSLLGELYGRQARRSITALTLWGGFSITVTWPLSALLLEGLGWRATLVTYAAINLFVCLPLLIAIPRRSVQPYSPCQSSTAVDTASHPRERTMLLIMATMQALSGIVVTTFSVHLLIVLTGRGMTSAEAVALGSLIGPAQFVARLIDMAGGARFHPVWTMIIALGLNTGGLALLAGGYAAPALALCMIGAGTGMLSIARGSLPLAIFGARRYPVVMGLLARPSWFAQAAAPVFGSLAIGALGIAASLWILTAAALLSLILGSVLATMCRATSD